MCFVEIELIISELKKTLLCFWKAAEIAIKKARNPFDKE
jgi:hypothetical protein